MSREGTPVVMAITDRHQFGGDDALACDRLVDGARVWAAAGIDIIQVRERGISDRDLLALVRRVIAAVSGTPCAVLVNDRLDVALAAAAHGVHLPEAGLPAGRVRALAPLPFRIGRSVHGSRDARAAAREGGCDYLLLGTLFSSRSKPPGHPIAGPGALAACADVPVPILAVGGITLDTAPAAFAAGASGVAGITLFSDPLRDRRTDAPAVSRAIVDGLRTMFTASRGGSKG